MLPQGGGTRRLESGGCRMLENLDRIEARIAVLEQRFAALAAPPAETGASPASSFAQALAEASRAGESGTLPPAPVDSMAAAPLREARPNLPPPPRWMGHVPDAGDSEEAVRRAACRHGVDPSLAVAVARAESGFNPLAVSSSGALGLMQLMPGTARSLGVSDPFDAEQNADGGVRYLAEQLRRFGDVRLALAAYNAGPNRVARHGEVPPIPETQRYVERVLEYQQQYRASGSP